ncbi:hypothetical protein [Fluviispira sanaruensis]|uniref:Outer membrane protein beta-barrel domain-containing protein n=1 Tax=Fluviispira sanaruensis TaxID=2493639 RepID=A0A4V0P287_FLUSA|nr:hypothetical protein [Fluviispira sanaruensis]BBH52367.1 hypothetical protein JCM31447_08080 [Fluviispira sanaruensis]
MSLKFLIYLLYTITSLSIYAQNESASPKHIDLIGSVGFSFLNNFSESIENVQSTNGSQSRVGSEFNISGLYTFPEIGVVSPILGAGLHIVHTSKKINEINFNGRYIIYWVSFETNVGLKINIAPEFMLYTLANFGFAGATRIENDANKYDSDAKVKNHYYFGATAIALIPLTDSVGMGGSFSMNKHQLNILNINNSYAPASINRFTAALVLIYSL